MLFKRQNQPALDLFTRTLELMKQRRSVVWLGASGIGKSAAMNWVIIDILRGMHGKQDGFPEQLIVRVNDQLYSFSSSLECSIENRVPGQMLRLPPNSMLVYEVNEGPN